MFCYQCGRETPVERQPGRNDTCPSCQAYLHSCRNCRFYDVKAHHECREPQAEWVQDKALGNFCEFFEAASSQAMPSTDRAAEARRKLDELFRKKE
jgi:hypothetical protein